MATVLTKPLVFFSASLKERDWRERLKVRLSAFEGIEWWDDSQIPVGALWAEEIPKALARAKMAVVLLSPDYLESQMAGAELKQMATLAATDLRLFPIVVHACDWRRHDVIARAQVWANGQPLDSLPLVEDELQKIALEIARQALDVAAPPRPVSAPALNPPASFVEEKGAAFSVASDSSAPAWAALRGKLARFRFSDGTERVLTRAGELAEQTRRPGLSSSCLLFALAETAGNVQDTSRFVRETMDRTGQYNTALADFLADLGSREPGLGTDRTVSANVQAMLDRATALARRSSKAQRSDIHRRHLFAALLLTVPGGRRQAGALRRLQALGLDAATLASEFREYLRTGAPEDDQGAWDVIVRGGPDASAVKPAAPKGVEPEAKQTVSAATAPYVSGPAGYTSEFVGVGGAQPVTDELGVEGMAHRLAELIALRETKMPLAIGLFGDWGSGKSHFMNLMDRRLKALACETPAGGAWCTEIVPIYFNAWHYLDANLWASLVTEIFDGLFRHLQPKGDALEAARVQLRAAGGAAARAEEEVTRARAEATAASVELQSARGQAAEAQRTVDGLLDNLKLLLPYLTSPAMRDQVEQWLGVRAEVATLSQLVEKRRELTTTAGRIRALWGRLIAEPGRWWRLGWLAGALVVMPLALWLGPESVSILRPLLVRIGPSVRVALGAIIGSITWTITWLKPAYAHIVRGLDQMERLQGQAEAAAAKARTTDPNVIAAERRLRDKEAAAVAAQAKLADAKALEQRLTQAVEDLLPERRLTRFIETRAQSADYRGQLGLVSLARRDFQQLSDIFTDSEALAAKKKTLPPKEAAALETLGASIDRIVLFVDDLDRCQPDKVVDVLQAVHLLLAYPLFAVVVGVDQRCLRQSLRTQFGGLLTGDRPEKEPSRQASDSDEDERPATPLDYLEKIFHVPFHLPPMNKDGFSDLMTALTKPGDSRQQAKAPEGTTPASTAPPNSGAALPTGASPAGSPGAPAPVALPTGGTSAMNASGTPQGSGSAPPKTIGSVPLQEWERTAIKDYYSLVRTPRGATRFLNTYRLLRAGIEEREWTAFHGDGTAHGEFRIAMLLLASAAGYPAVARDWFRLLREKVPHEVQAEDVEADANGWKQFKTVYEITVGRATPGTSLATVVKWIDRVEQFAF